MKRLAALVACATLGTAGCAGDAQDADLTVSAAASLRTAVGSYAESFDGARVRVSFAGSDELAAQIRQGARPDVFVAANTKLPEALYAEGLVERPVVFAGNRVVVAVGTGSEIGSIDDLARPGVKVAMGSDTVPVGEYTREVLDRLAPPVSKAILANVRSREPDVKGVVGKVSQGAVDAGFVYVTDVVSTGGDLRPVELPAALRPAVAYGAAVVKGGSNPDAARRFVDGLVSGEGARLLREAGFEQPR